MVASQQISPMRKDVLAKCYGGDISRKKKLLKKQAEGKKRMKAVGSVEVPQEAFMAMLDVPPRTPAARCPFACSPRLDARVAHVLSGVGRMTRIAVSLAPLVLAAETERCCRD